MKHFFSTQVFSVWGDSLKSHKGGGQVAQRYPTIPETTLGFKCKGLPSRGVGYSHNTPGGLENARGPVRAQQLHLCRAEATSMAGL